MIWTFAQLDRSFSEKRIILTIFNWIEAQIRFILRLWTSWLHICNVQQWKTKMRKKSDQCNAFYDIIILPMAKVLQAGNLRSSLAHRSWPLWLFEIMTTLKLAACSLCYLLKWCHGLLSRASCPPSSTTVWQVRQLELWQVRLLPHCHTLSRSCHCVTMIRDKSGMGVAHAGISSSATVFPPVSKSREEFATTNNRHH